MSISDDQPINVGNLKAVCQALKSNIISELKTEMGGGISLR